MFDSLFTVPAVEALFSDEALIDGMLRFESALAAVQADLGVIPERAASYTGECWACEQFSIHVLLHSAERDGNPAIPLVKALGKSVATICLDSAKYGLKGATIFDVIDTVL